MNGPNKYMGQSTNMISNLRRPRVPDRIFSQGLRKFDIMLLFFQSTNSDKIVDTFTFLTPYFVTVIPFCPPSLSIQHPPLPKQCCATITVILGNKQATLNGGAGSFPQFFSP